MIKHPRSSPKDWYYIGKITFETEQEDPECTVKLGLPKEYQRHYRIFSETESKQLPKFTVWDHTIELLPDTLASLPGWLLPLTIEEQREAHNFIKEHLEWGTIRESKSLYATNFFFVWKKDRKLWPVQNYRPLNKLHQEEPKCLPLNPSSHQLPVWMHSVHKIWYKIGVQQHLYQRRRQMERSVLNSRRIIRTARNVFWNDKLSGNLPNNG